MVNGAVRSLMVAMGVRDQATRIVGALKKDVLQLDGKVVKSTIKATDSASPAIKAVAQSFHQCDTAIGQAFHSLQIFDRGASKTAIATAKMRGAFDSANKAIKSYSSALDDAKKRTESLNSLKAPLASVAAISGGIIAVSAKSAASYNKNLTDIKNTLLDEDQSQKYLKWIETGATMNKLTRSQLAKDASKYVIDISELSAEENVKFLDLLAAEATRLNVDSSQLSSAMKGVYKGTPEEMMSLLGMSGIDTDAISKAAEAERKSNPAKWAGASESELKAYTTVKLYTAALEERQRVAEAAGGAETEDLNRLGDAITDIRINLGKTFLPVISAISKAAGAAATFTSKFPKASMLIAVGAALAFVVSTLGLFIITAGPAWAALTAVAAGMTLSSVAAGVLSAAMSVLNIIMALNPAVLIVMALIALGAALYYVEKKTGALSKAWAWLVELWDDLKAGDIGDIGKKAASIMFKMVFPVAVLSAFLKIPKIHDNIEKVAKYLKSLIPGWLESIFDTVKGWYDKLKTALVELAADISQIVLGMLPDWLKEKVGLIKGTAAANKEFVEGDEASVQYFAARRFGVVRSFDEGYKVATFSTAEGLSAEQMVHAAELMKEFGTEYKGSTYMLKSGLDQMEASDAALFAWKPTDQIGMTPGEIPEGIDVAAYNAFVGQPELSKGVRTPVDEAKAGLASKTTEPSYAEAITEAFTGPIKAVVKPVVEAGTQAAEYHAAVSPTTTVDPGKTEATKGKFTVRDESTGTLYSYDPATGGWQKFGRIGGFLSTETGWSDIDEGAVPSYTRSEALEQIGGAATGGGIETTGLLIGHEGEEYSPADIVHKTTAAERLVEMLVGGGRGSLDEIVGDTEWQSGAGKAGKRSKDGDNINVTVNVTVNGVKESFSKFDLTRLIETHVRRVLGQYKT